MKKNEKKRNELKKLTNNERLGNNNLSSLSAIPYNFQNVTSYSTITIWLDSE